MFFQLFRNLIFFFFFLRQSQESRAQGTASIPPPSHQGARSPFPVLLLGREKG